jgi:hypothetical protein
MRFFVLCAALCGCARLSGYGPDAGRKGSPIKDYADGAEGLQALFSDILEAATKDDRDRVHDLMASLQMTDDELRGLFGARAERLLPRYHLLMETLVNRGSVELVAQVYERKYDQVEAIPIEASGPIKNATPADRAVAAALQRPVPIWAVRFKRAGDARGMRYDFFVYLNGHWRTGNQLGRWLDGGPDGGG